jgi:ABC-type dipeptide/oligopeptide/nickel transport system permease component
MTISLMYVFVVLTASLVIDILTALIDPRVRLGKE